LEATTNLARPLPPRIPPATNSLSRSPSTFPKTNAIGSAKPSGTKTNAVAATETPWNKGKHSLQKLRGTQAFYPLVIGVPVCLIAAAVFLSRFFKGKSATDLVAQAPSLASRPVKREAKIHSCNVLEMGTEAQHLWRFEA